MDVNTDQFFPSVVLTILDSKGRPAAVEGVPIWASSDETVIRVTPDATGMSAVVDTVAPGGPARITVTADADLGAGTTTLTGVTEDILVALGPSGQASVMTISLGQVQPKP